MILDSSALVAIALDEPEREVLIARTNLAETVGVAAPTLVEARIVLSARSGRDAGEVLAELIAAADGVIIDFGPLCWREAVPAGSALEGAAPGWLEFGDCLAYATAASADEPLFAKGEDSPQTDIPSRDHEFHSTSGG